MESKYSNVAFRCFVGFEDGFTGEGNEQWFYFLSLVINSMLVWWLAPEIAIFFIVFSAIHLFTVATYGFFKLEDKLAFAYIYVFIHCCLFLFAILLSFKWTAITTTITVVSLLFAPNYKGNIIISHTCNVPSGLPLFFNTLIFTIFVIVTILLPIYFWIKLVIILVALTLHPFIDYLEEKGIMISRVTLKVFCTIKP